MAKQNSVIVTCAVTGGIHTPSMSPHLPVTPNEIAQAAIGASEAGATVIHLHARDPVDGRPTQDPDMFMQFLPRIKQQTDAVINITTGGAHLEGGGYSVDVQVGHPFGQGKTTGGDKTTEGGAAVKP